MADYGFRVIIAPSFAEIFFSNCFKNVLLPIMLPEREVDALFQAVAARPGFRLAVNLRDQVIRLPDGAQIAFEVAPFRKYRLINGLDDIGLTLQHADKVRAYEALRRQQEPWAV